MENSLNKKNNGKNAIIAVLCIALLASIGFICYDKVLNKKNEKECPKTECQCEKCEESNELETKLTNLKNIELTDKNQTIKIGNTNVKIRIEDGYLLIDDNYVYETNSSNKIAAMHGYLTDKYVFFTGVAQDGEVIEYAIGEKGTIIVNDNDYQMMNFKLIDGYLHANGHIFCGLDGDCPDKDLIIKLEGNTLTVVPFE